MPSRFGPAEVATVTLTFDDGPDPVWTPRVLDRLRHEGAVAVFYVMSDRARRHPDLVRAMVAEGHAVGLHCRRHVRHSASARSRVEADADAALAALEAIGVRPLSWRTPWGDVAPWTEQVARTRGLRLAGWTADTHDWRGDPAGAMLSRVAPRLGPDAVVLMHDGLGPGARRTGCAETVRLIGPLCAAARAAGWGVTEPRR